MVRAATIGLLVLLGWRAGAQGIARTELLTPDVREFEKTEWDIYVTGAFRNPYDQAEVSLDLVMVSPSGQPVVVPCYYEQDSLWKARYAPRETGKYRYFFRLTVAGAATTEAPRAATATTTTAATTAVTATTTTTTPTITTATVSQELTAGRGTRPGFLHKNDYYSFRFDNGELFRGIGENLGWESRAFENGKWTYNYLLPVLARNGANFFRTWSCPWNLPLEWKKPGNTRRYVATDRYFNPGGIRRMEELLRLCDSLGLYFMLTLDMNSGNWANNPYNQVNGGPVASWGDFFVSTRAMQKYKDKLRYIVARWGYSTRIAAWEFFNEIDNGVFNKADSVLIPHSAVTHWHDEMSRYLKDIDPYGHLVTTSISHRDIQGLNSIAYIDFNQKHIYKHTEKIPSIYPDYIQAFGKPYVVGEFGYRWEDADPQYAAEADFDYRRGLWYGLFSPTPILPMSWWWEFFDEQGMEPVFREVRAVSERMLRAGRGSFEPVTVEAGKLHAQGLRCGAETFIYLLNESDHPVETELRVGGKPGGRLRRLDAGDLGYKEVAGWRVGLPARKDMILLITEK